MVSINSSGTRELFTGAYNKRVEQNKSKAAAEARKAEHKDTMTAKEALGTTVEISEESKEFMAGVAERKAEYLASREAEPVESGNAFNGTGDFRQQYLVLSENLYNNGFYDKLSDQEVRDMEEMRDSFKEMIKQYESYNSKKVASYKNIYDLRDESMAKIPAPNAVNVSAAVKKSQEDVKASMEIGRVKHTKEQEQQNREAYQTLFDSLMQKQDSAANIFHSLQNTLVEYASGGSKNSNVLAMLNSRNFVAIHHMSGYWSRLLG